MAGSPDWWAAWTKTEPRTWWKEFWFGFFEGTWKLRYLYLAELLILVVAVALRG